MRFSKLLWAAGVAAAVAGVPFLVSVPANATTWNAAADFSTAQNPNGQWAYGEGTAGTNPTLFVNSFTQAGGDISPVTGSQKVSYWQSSTQVSRVPLIGENFGSGQSSCCNTVLIPTGVLWMHPGQNLDAIVQWTAPSAGTYSYAGSFALLDTSPTGIIGEVFLNGTLLFSGTLTGPAATLSPGSAGG